MKTAKSYHKLIVWQKAHRLVIEIYSITKSFPRFEQFDLVSQVRRSAKSVATNIVEGHASKFTKVFLNYLDKANSSLVETEYHLELSRDLGYLTLEVYQDLDALRAEVGALLFTFIESLRKKSLIPVA